MPEDFLPGDVERFVLECIPSVVHLEALLLLRRRPDESVSGEAMAALLFVTPAVALSALDDLASKGLLLKTGTRGPFRYAAQSPESQATIDALAEAHRTRLLPLSRFIHEQAQARTLRDFANAFRLRKD
jgi:hypothetical protein